MAVGGMGAANAPSKKKSQLELSHIIRMQRSLAFRCARDKFSYVTFYGHSLFIAWIWDFSFIVYVFISIG